MNATLLISSYCRPQYLNLHLHSLLSCREFWPCDCQILVLNDGIEDETEQVAKQHGVDYLFTGQRNKKNKLWRCPGFTFNIGIKQVDSDIIVLSCAEMYHLNNSLESVLTPVIKNSYALGTPIVYDDHGPLLNHLRYNTTSFEDAVTQVKQTTKQRISESDPFIANSYMPYFLAVRREHLLTIGGYDEDFIGRGADDNDLMERLIGLGCTYHRTKGEVVHLYHKHPTAQEMKKDPRYQYNLSLWKKRRGKIVRNNNRDWGILNEERN